jgi:integrase
MAAIYKAAVSYGYPFGHIVRILLLVPVRRNEATSLRWEYLVRDTIELPGTVTKNHQSLSLPVCPMLAAVLRSVPRTSSPFLFPSRHDPDRVFSGFSKCKGRLDELSGVSDYTLHDCRRSISTMLAGPPISTPPHVIDALLNHVTGHATISEVAAIYNRYKYQEEARSAMLTYETTFGRLLEGA